MKAARLTSVKAPLDVVEVPDPSPSDGGVVVRVEAEGICRTDWHVWRGDWEWVGLVPDLPVTMGHEMAGTVVAVGGGVRSLRTGQTVVVPFHEACGTCIWCRSGKTNLCDNLRFIGISHDGGYAEFVAVDDADFNCVPLPDGIDPLSGAAIGCRYMTAWHALTRQVPIGGGEWVVVHGTGGVGLSAIQIAVALGADVIAVDIDSRKLQRARELGAGQTVDARGGDVVERVVEMTQGGADVSFGGLGTEGLVQQALLSLRKGGRHVQVGLTSREEEGRVSVPLDLMIERELTMVGSVGNPHVNLAGLLRLVAEGKLRPADLVSERVALSEVNGVLDRMSSYDTIGFSMVTDTSS